MERAVSGPVPVKILVVSCNWPPATGSGIQRILKLCKYLREYGYQPEVLTAAPENHTRKDTSLYTDAAGITTYPIDYRLNPLRWFAGTKKRSGGTVASKGGGVRTIFRYLLNFMWLNFLIPDARVGWLFAVRRAARQILRQGGFKAVVSTGPPYTNHLVGLHIKKKYGLPWVMDIRDPWVESVSYNTAYRFPWVIGLNRLMESRCLRACDRAVPVTDEFGDELQRKLPPAKVSVISNGYDADDFTALAYKNSDIFRLGYYGKLSDARLPEMFLRQLAGHIASNNDFARDFKLTIFGTVSAGALKALEAILPQGSFAVNAAVPHEQLIDEYGYGQVFLLLKNNDPLNRFTIPGKLYEYLYVGWPVLGIGPEDGETGRIINDTGAGRMFAHGAPAGPVEFLAARHREWLAGKMVPHHSRSDSFDRRCQAGEFSRVLDGITGTDG